MSFTLIITADRAHAVQLHVQRAGIGALGTSSHATEAEAAEARDEAKKIRVSFDRRMTIVGNGLNDTMLVYGTGKRSLVEWVYLVKCVSSGFAPEVVEAAAQLCLDSDQAGAPCGVWHALSTVNGRLETCNCHPCTRVREARRVAPTPGIVIEGSRV